MNFIEPYNVHLYSMKKRMWYSCIAFAMVLVSAALLRAEPVHRDHVSIELVSDQSAARPGDTVTVGLKIQLEDEWHVYWTNPGDAGLAPRVKWNLPPGFVASPLQFPVPKRIPAGPLVSFGYDKELLLLSDIVIPSDFIPDSLFSFNAEVDWLVCKVECIPGDAVLSLMVPIVENGLAEATAWDEQFRLVRTKQAVEDMTWIVTASASKTDLQLIFTSKSERSSTIPSDVFFFPTKKGIIDNSAAQVLAKKERGFELTIPLNSMNTDTLTEISGLLVAENQWANEGTRTGLKFSAPVTMLSAPTPIAFAAVEITWWQAILFAFVGGLILNLMPCVLPVLSIKVLSFVQQAGEGRKQILQHNAVFTLGVLVSFWILAAGLLLLRAGGEQLGWGFQLQSPTFIIILASFMFLMALNLLGVFEVGTSLTGIVGNSRRSGLLGSFIAGVTATVVATPCTAPFMGSALGYSLTQPALISLAIFTALGLGMSAPYVILTSTPWLLRFVPKPGRWMETLKHVMGFLLMATVVWLVWVLSIQAGSDSILLLLATLLVLGLCAWILGRWGGYAVEQGKRVTAITAAVALALASVSLASFNVTPADSVASGMTQADGLTWEPFSPERVTELNGQGRPLLIDFTAAWCLSCKVNERVAFGSLDVQGKLSSLSVVTMKADWTSRDERITKALAEFGRNSVPLYVLYTGKTGQSPIVLPELLTPGIVIEALNKLEG